MYKIALHTTCHNYVALNVNEIVMKGNSGTYNFFFIYYCLDSQNMIVCYHGFWKTFLVDFV